MPLRVKSLEDHVADLNAARIDLLPKQDIHQLLSRLQGDALAQIMSYFPLFQQIYALSAVSPQVRMDSEMLTLRSNDTFPLEGYVSAHANRHLMYSFPSLDVLTPKVMQRCLWWAKRCRLPYMLYCKGNRKKGIELFPGSMLQHVHHLSVTVRVDDVCAFNEMEALARQTKRTRTESAADIFTPDSCHGRCGSLLCMLAQFIHLSSFSIQCFDTPNGDGRYSFSQAGLRPALRLAASLPLESVEIQGMSNPACLAELAGVRSLRYLTVKDYELSSLAPWLQDLSYLRELIVVAGELTSRGVEGLAALRHLRVLALSCSNLSTLEEISECRSLTKLWIDDNDGVDDLSALSGHPSLVELYADGCSICNLFMLHLCPRLRILHFTCDSSLLSLEDLAEAPSLVELKVEEFQGSSLQPLALCPKLTRVILSECSRLTSLAGLAGAPQLAEIIAAHCPLAELGPLHLCPKLQRLDLSQSPKLRTLDGMARSTTLEFLSATNCDLQNVKALATCANLREVDVSYNRMLDSLSGLDRLVNLVTLRAVECNIRDLSNLSSCPNLQRIDVSRNDFLTDVGGVSGAPRLFKLDARCCQRLRSLNGLNRCPCLEELDVESNPIQRLDELAGALRLRILRARCSILESIEGLQSCPSLESLVISQCSSLRGISPLAGLPKLSSILADSCGIRGVEGLERCPTLRTVILQGNRELTSIASLAGSPSLCTLDVSGCGLAALGQLSQCPELREVDASANFSLSTLAGLEGAPSLQKFKASPGNLCDVSALASCPLLHTVDVSRNSHLSNLLPITEVKHLYCLTFDLSSLRDLSKLCLCTTLRQIHLVCGREQPELPKLLPLGSFAYYQYEKDNCLIVDLYRQESEE